MSPAECIGCRDLKKRSETVWGDGVDALDIAGPYWKPDWGLWQWRECLEAPFLQGVRVMAATLLRAAVGKYDSCGVNTGRDEPCRRIAAQPWRAPGAAALRQAGLIHHPHDAFTGLFRL